jgi:hypothetical protein
MIRLSFCHSLLATAPRRMLSGMDAEHQFLPNLELGDRKRMIEFKGYQPLLNPSGEAH